MDTGLQSLIAIARFHQLPAEPGQIAHQFAAEVKLHTFPFTKYVVVDAEVINVSDDATVDEKLGLIYRMQIRMAKNTLWVKGKKVKLQPGMAVTA